MKNFIFKICTIGIVCIPCSLYASTIWDEETVRKISLSLADKPEELATFMRIISGTEPHVRTFMASPSPQENSSFDELLEGALQRRNRIEINASDILSERSLHSSRDVTDIDLSEFTPQTREEVEKVANYFYEQPLCNLRVLTLPKSPVELLTTIFSDTVGTPKYCSLFRIVATNTSGIKDADLDTIFKHFSSYPYFVRDDEKVSERFGGVAAFLAIAGGISVSSSYDWSLGKKTLSENYNIHYRNGQPSRQGAFIMTVRGW